MPYRVLDENIYPFPNCNGAAVEIWEWISNFTPLSTMDVITYPCRDKSLYMLVKGTQQITNGLFCNFYFQTMILKNQEFAIANFL